MCKGYRGAGSPYFFIPNVPTLQCLDVDQDVFVFASRVDVFLVNTCLDLGQRKLSLPESSLCLEACLDFLLNTEVRGQGIVVIVRIVFVGRVAVLEILPSKRSYLLIPNIA